MEEILKTMLRTVGTVSVLALAGALASCATMSNLMGGGGQQVTLSGANEVPQVNTGASGTGTVTVTKDRNVSAKINVTGMTATAAHIHEGAAGSNGPVIVPFTKTGDNQFSAPEGARMTEAQYAAYKAGRTYVNVHSARNPGGEVRAQLKGE
jgi:hypothetical protein